MDELTAKLAIWGAVTGTIGAVAGIVNLYFRFVQHRKDRAHITAEAVFEHSLNFEGIEPNYYIVVRSHGKTPVTIDFLYLCVRPKLGFWKSLLRKKLWAEYKWIHRWEPRQLTTLPQGRREKFKIEQPRWAGWPEVLGAYVVDQTGKKWKVKWPQPAHLAKKLEFERLLETTEFTEGKRKVRLAAFRYGEHYRIHVNWSGTDPRGSITSRYFGQSSRSAFDARLKEISDVAIPQLLNSEIDEIK